jgi:CRISPR-associated protein Cst2
MNVKNPIFLESLKLKDDNTIDHKSIKNVIDDFSDQISEYVFGERKGFFAYDNNEYLPLGKCFKNIKTWAKEAYEE